MKKFKRDITNIATAGVMLGVGSSVVSKSGAGDIGLGGFASIMPPMVAISGGSMVMRQVKKLKKSGW